MPLLDLGHYTNGFPAVTDTNFAYKSLSPYGERYTASAKGFLTGIITARLNDGTIPSYDYTVKYYDERSRVVQEKSTNHLDGYDQTYFAYNFVDQPIMMQHVHSAKSKLTQTERYTYTYDHAGRLMTTKHQLNGVPETLLVNNSYDELGRLQSNQRNGQANLKTNYTYNIRSWMKTISNPLFNETLYYQDAPSTFLAGYEPNYNGNISAMSWDVFNTVDQKEATRSYCFNYDNLSRLTQAGYTETNKPTANFSTSYAYDSHGNITALKRSGRTGTSSYGAIDDLTLSYQGNQLITVEDAAPTFNISESADFKNGSNQPLEYSYDKNGNLTKDLNKGISIISYNSLNLPISLSIANASGSALNNYTYSADGRKLKVEMKYGVNRANTKTTDYVGNMIYENGSLKRILVDGGYIENDKYYYYIQDHLGNNRVVAQADGSVLQASHYYPFGMTFTENNTGDSKAQPYKYNGKEFDGERGLNVYDYSA
ncbi:MAG: RHS repeat domain-containing protein, partial [Bacteroides sp.]